MILFAKSLVLSMYPHPVTDLLIGTVLTASWKQPISFIFTLWQSQGLSQVRLHQVTRAAGLLPALHENLPFVTHQLVPEIPLNVLRTTNRRWLC